MLSVGRISPTQFQCFELESTNNFFRASTRPVMKTAIIRTVFPRLGMMPPFRLHRPPRVLKASQSYPASQKAVPLLFFFLSAWTLKRCRLCFAVLFCLKKRRLKSRKATGKISAACRKGTNLLHFAQPRVRKKKKTFAPGNAAPVRSCLRYYSAPTQARGRVGDSSGCFPTRVIGVEKELRSASRIASAALPPLRSVWQARMLHPRTSRRVGNAVPEPSFGKRGRSQRHGFMS